MFKFIFLKNEASYGKILYIYFRLIFSPTSPPAPLYYDFHLTLYVYNFINNIHQFTLHHPFLIVLNLYQVLCRRQTFQRIFYFHNNENLITNLYMNKKDDRIEFNLIRDNHVDVNVCPVTGTL